MRLHPVFSFQMLSFFHILFQRFFDGLALKILLPARFLLSNITYLPSALTSFIFLSPQPVNLSESLEGVLLSMCEESSQLRAPLLKVLEVCLIYEQLDIFQGHAVFPFLWWFNKVHVPYSTVVPKALIIQVFTVKECFHACWLVKSYTLEMSWKHMEML